MSDTFEYLTEDPDLELVVTVLNINHGNNEAILEQCQTLREYMIYVERLRKYKEEMTLEEAVERTIQECIKEGILSEFLTRNRKEAVEVSIFEYNEELVIQDIRKDEFRLGKEEGLEQGVIQGQIQSILELLLELGEIPKDLEENVRNEKDISQLKADLKVAAKASDIEEFREMTGK